MTPAPDAPGPDLPPEEAAATPPTPPTGETARPEPLGEHHGFEADPRRAQELKAQQWAGILLVTIGGAFAVYTLGAPVRTGWLAAAPIAVGIGFLVRTLR